uniref:(California timema) hypothetical protein n=1 Tax=Timema californicum TaxID=61474 RepID=A0A7R9P8J2_TIMCA|nr:unnamed protein product [Timema californicum]
MFGANENCESSSLISLEQFSSMTKNLWRNRDGNKHIWDMFQALDPTDKVFLVLEDLEQARKQVVPHLQEWRLREAFRQTDKDADKRVGFREFREFVTQNMENNLFLNRSIYV